MLLLGCFELPAGAVADFHFEQHASAEAAVAAHAMSVLNMNLTPITGSFARLLPTL